MGSFLGLVIAADDNAGGVQVIVQSLGFPEELG